MTTASWFDTRPVGSYFCWVDLHGCCDWLPHTKEVQPLQDPNICFDCSSSIAPATWGGERAQGDPARNHWKREEGKDPAEGTLPSTCFTSVSFVGDSGSLFRNADQVIFPYLWQIDPSILGGLVVEFSQKVFDMSIKSRAKQMERFLRQPITDLIWSWTCHHE